MRGGVSIFDSMSYDDLIMAFFPCIYFSCMSQMLISYTHRNYTNMTPKERMDAILERSANRELFFARAVKMLAVAQMRGLRLVMENPWSEQTYLKANFVAPPTLFDMDRTKRGDYYTKPTAYWFINCEHTYGKSFQKPKERKSVMFAKPSLRAGLCSEERSMISPDYARNFICDFIIGKEQHYTERSLFKELM